MSGHTPGPWQIVPFERWSSQTWFIEARPQAERAIAVVSSTEANARLIAAAPELLAALREMVDRFESADDAPAYVERARAAMAKAEGQP